MRRVLVIGSGGAGKSTLARAIGARLGLPVVHLDRLYWRPGWRKPSSGAWAETIDREVAADAWVMDGNFGETMDRRLAAADTVVFLDLPRLLCLWRVVRRRFRYAGRSRPDMTEGCPERLDAEFLAWIWGYPATRRPRVLARLAAAGHVRVVQLRSRREVRQFLADLPPRG